VLGNNISGSRDGLGVQSSSNITLEKNRISNVLHEGICLDETTGSKISGNIIKSSDEDGLHLLNSNGCLLAGNIVSKSCCGLRLESSHNNTLYINSLRDNRDHNAYDDGINLWDNGQKGNYYHDYARSGDCNPSGYFCTSPYPIPGGSSVDRYPLANEEMGL
jgi:parallel beta-helix repeat protein